MKHSIDLNGTWQLRWYDGGERGERLGRLLRNQVEWERAWPAMVPGSVHETLLELGRIPDPHLGTNVLACRWVEEMIWYYRRTFQAPRLLKGERAWLVFDALDLAAQIYVNGKEAGRHANAFYPCRLDVTDLLVSGTNNLLVRIESGLFHAMHRSAAGLNVREHHQLTKMPWLRQTMSQHGWDWSPRLLNVGLRGGVRLEIASGVSWEGASLFNELSEDLGEGKVTARVFARNLGEKPCQGELTLTIKETGETVRAAVELQPGANILQAVLAVSKPKLWWPVGHGKQNRYSASISLRVGGRETGSAARRFGFRHVRINQDPHPKEGQYFVVEINHKPIFCKGGNYVPVDLILSRADGNRHAALVDLALESNCNFLRIWGGGVYESDEFYEICDAKGILVWQEFVFACAKYPVFDEAFLADVTREATHQVRRLAHHPSLVIWCGNNEMEVGCYNWGYDKGVAYPDYALFHLVLPRVLKAEDPTRYYQPSSPISPEHEAPNADHLGDQHPWSIGFGDNDFRKYRDMISRFPNEGGILGPNSLPTVRAALTGDPDKPHGFAWELHDNATNYWDDTPPYATDLMIEQWLGKRVKEMTIEEYVYWAGVVQGSGLAEYIKNFRRRMFDSSAAIFWMYNDIWPCSRSWTIVDYYLRRTPAFWPVRRAFAPVTVVVTREGKSVRVYGVNEGSETTGTLRFGLMELAGNYPLDESKSVTLPTNASTLLAEFPAAQWDKLGIKTHVAFAVLVNDAGEIARDCLILPLFREMKWPEAKVSVTQKGGKAIFTSDTFAWRVCLDLDGEQPLADNFFDIYPDIPTVLQWPEKLGKPKILRIGNPQGKVKQRLQPKIEIS